MKLNVETIVADAMRELADAHRAYKAFLSSDEPADADAAERKQQHLYAKYCAARDRVVALAEQMFPSGATRRVRSSS